MSTLIPTEHYGRITWIGVVRHRAATLASEPLEDALLSFDGIPGESHGGATRPSCSRVIGLYPERGTEIRNARQISILSAEEMADTAAAIGLPAIYPGWIGANLVLEGIPDLTKIPPASRLVAPSGASIAVDAENGPCRFPADLIEVEHPGHGRKWAKAAMGRRGVVAWVERPGEIKIGDALRLHIPPRRLWGHG
ncbi:MAG: hypothetical protein ACJA1L_001499 [Paracoccaceae bacterium]|jgi:hypothetical protein